MPTTENTQPTATPKKKRKKGKVTLKKGIFYINASYNNTIITLTDQQGSVVTWYSAGRSGFKGPKKSTPYAAGMVIRKLADEIKNTGLVQADIIVKGIGMGRDAAIRAISGLGVQIQSIKDKTPVPHNGPRKKKVRRV